MIVFHLAASNLLLEMKYFSYQKFFLRVFRSPKENFHRENAVLDDFSERYFQKKL